MMGATPLYGQHTSDQVQQLITYPSSQLQHQAINTTEIDQLIVNSSVSQNCGNPFSILSHSHPYVLIGTWVIDTCAIHHVCYDLSLFFESNFFFQNTIVTLPNGRLVDIERIASVKGGGGGGGGVNWFSQKILSQ